MWVNPLRELIWVFIYSPYCKPIGLNSIRGKWWYEKKLANDKLNIWIWVFLRKIFLKFWIFFFLNSKKGIILSKEYFSFISMHSQCSENKVSVAFWIQNVFQFSGPFQVLETFCKYSSFNLVKFWEYYWFILITFCKAFYLNIVIFCNNNHHNNQKCYSFISTSSSMLQPSH